MFPLLSKKQSIQYICIVAAVFLLSVGPTYWCGEYTERVPILMYHQITDDGDINSSISCDAFESHIKALRDAGYTSISFEELYDYAANNAPLPERRVIITFDDGYMSVYDYAFPILEKYGMKATVSIVGVLFGESTYKGLYYLPISPHFGDAEAREMAESGVFSIQSHSFDMHHFIPYEIGPPRVGILRRSDESLEEYVDAFIDDYSHAAEQIEASVGVRPFVYSYPFGRSTKLSEKLLKDMGVTVTLTISPHINTVVKGCPDSLFKLGRLNVSGDMSPEELLELIRY